MGCMASKRDINDIHPNIFHVLNVDDDGVRHSQGQLEVAEAHLVLYQKGKEPVRWPLKCLRRYGFETNMFSFESGRRCKT
ncbi:Putative LOC100877025, partial [Caligus rogercresseyi]